METTEGQVKDYRCGPITRKFHLDQKSRVKLLIGPFGTGKTTSAFVDQILYQSRRVLPDQTGVIKTAFAIVRNTIPQLKQTTMRTIFEWFPPYVFGTYNDTEKTYIVKLAPDNLCEYPRHITFFFKALDIEKDVRNLLSLELTGAWVDEAREINHDVVLGLLGRMKRYPHRNNYTNGASPYITEPQLVLTTNYPSREHWLYKMFVEDPLEGYSIYEQTQQENIRNLADGYYEQLEKDYRYRPDLLKTLVRGEWGVTVRGKQVYPEFSANQHVSTEPLLSLVLSGTKIGNKTIIRGWDNTGLSPACVISYINGLGQWLLFKEFIGEDVGIVDFGHTVTQWCNQMFSGVSYRDIGDPAGKAKDSMKMSPRDYLKQHLGIYIEDGIQTFKVRREAIAERLTKTVGSEPAMLIDPSLIRLIDGFEGGYAYGEIGSTGVFKTEPQKNEYSHVHDAIQYAATRIFRDRNKYTEADCVPVYLGEP